MKVSFPPRAQRLGETRKKSLWKGAWFHSIGGALPSLLWDGRGGVGWGGCHSQKSSDPSEPDPDLRLRQTGGRQMIPVLVELLRVPRGTVNAHLEPEAFAPSHPPFF